MGDQPTSETTLNDYPTMLARVDHTEPVLDVDPGLIVDEQTVKQVRQEIERVYGLRVPQVTHAGRAMQFADDSLKGSFRQGALRLGCRRPVVRGGREVFVHPRNPYTGWTR